MDRRKATLRGEVQESTLSYAILNILQYELESIRCVSGAQGWE